MEKKKRKQYKLLYKLQYKSDWMYDHRQIFSLIFVPILWSCELETYLASLEAHIRRWHSIVLGLFAAYFFLVYKKTLFQLLNKHRKTGLVQKKNIYSTNTHFLLSISSLIRSSVEILLLSCRYRGENFPSVSKLPCASLNTCLELQKFNSLNWIN